MLENKKPVQCLMCKKTFDVLADVEQYNKVVMPSRCQAQGNAKPCNSYKFQMVEPPPGRFTLTFYLKGMTRESISCVNICMTEETKY